MFELEFDQQEGLLKRRLWGFWSVDDVNNYVAQLDALIARIRIQNPNFQTLSDSAELAPQSAEVRAAMAESMKRICTANPGRVAIVVGSMINKLQVDSIYPYPNVRAFRDEESAREWLDQDRPRM
jgi:hypothetical protein